MRRKKNTSRRRVNTTAIMTLSIIGLIGFSFLLGLSLSNSETTNERAQLRIEEQRAVMPWKVTSRIVGYVAFGIFAKVGLVVMACYVVYYVIAIGRNWLDLRSRQVHAKDGLYPVIELQKGVLYDPNRDNAGAHPLIAMGALSVQKQAALKAEKITVKQTDRMLPKEANGQLEQMSVNWPSRVPLRGLLNGAPSINDLVLGVTVDNQGNSQIVRGSMSDLVHVAVGGSSGWGKSVFLQMLAYQIATAQEQPEICLIDLEGTTLNVFSQSERLLYPLADNERSAIAVLQALNSEMEKRKELFNQYQGVDRLDRYNARASQPLKPIVTFVDEATALLDNKQVEAYLKELTLRARKYGLWLVLAGQDWKATSLDTAIRNQLSTRVQFKALNGAQSRVLLGESDAKDIKAVGRAYAVLPGRPLTEMQAPFVNADMILNAVAGNGARNTMPDIQELDIVDAQIIEDDPSLPEDDRIRLLHKQCLSNSEIEQRVYGFTGGSAYRKVKNALSQ